MLSNNIENSGGGGGGGRGLQLTQANLQAQRQYTTRNPPPTTAYTSNVSYMSSAANSVLGDLPNTGGGTTTAGMRMSKRNSLSSTADHYSHNYYYHPSVKLENTYRLGPHDAQKFNASRVHRLVHEILQNHLENFKYEPNKCKDVVQLMSDEIKTRTKSILYKRYKLIVNLTIGQNAGNSLIMASRSLWNPDTDNECTVTYKNNTLFAIATVFACYFD